MFKRYPGQKSSDLQWQIYIFFSYFSIFLFISWTVPKTTAPRLGTQTQQQDCSPQNKAKINGCRPSLQQLAIIISERRNSNEKNELKQNSFLVSISYSLSRLASACGITNLLGARNCFVDICFNYLKLSTWKTVR